MTSKLPAPKALQGVTIARGGLRVQVPTPMNRPTLTELKIVLKQWELNAKLHREGAEELGLAKGVHYEGFADGMEHCIRGLRTLCGLPEEDT